MPPKNPTQAELPVDFVLDPPSLTPSYRDSTAPRRALMGLDYDQRLRQSPPQQEPPVREQATLRTTQPDRINGIPGTALQVPNKLATDSGARVPLKSNARGTASWQGAIAAAVSPALLPLKKLRDTSSQRPPKTDQAAHNSELPSGVMTLNPAGSSAARAKTAGKTATDAPAMDEEDFAARTAELIESLRPDGKGDDVKDLQRRLGLAPQGTYGPKTLAAIKRYVVGDEFDRVNAEMKTGIDFSSMLEYEGFSLDGYVPDVKDSQSGVTIGVGFDIGQFSKAEIKAFGFADGLTEKLLPYAGLKRADATEKLRETDGLKISVGEAKQIAYVVKREFVHDIAAKYDKARSEGVPKFTDLTLPQQTVVFSRFFHQGRFFTKHDNAKPWWTAVTTGKWADVQAILRDYPFATEPWYKTRVEKEASLLGDLSADTESK